MTHAPHGDALVTALRGDLPYLRVYQGKTFLIKIGGAALDGAKGVGSLVEQVALLRALGIRVMLVQGGGEQISRTADALGLPVQKVGGCRVTDQGTLDVTTMVLNGTVRTRLLAALREAGTPAVGISGVEGGLVRAKKRPPRQVSDGSTVDFGLLGDIEAIEPTLVTTLLDDGYVVVVSPLSADNQGTVLNINADSVAARLAVALKVEKLLLVTDAPGILRDARDPGSLVVLTDIAGLEKLEADGAQSSGMLPKVACVREALHGGVAGAHVISYEAPDSLLLEIFTTEGAGILVVREVADLRPKELAAAL